MSPNEAVLIFFALAGSTEDLGALPLPLPSSAGDLFVRLFAEPVLTNPEEVPALRVLDETVVEALVDGPAVFVAALLRLIEVTVTSGSCLRFELIFRRLERSGCSSPCVTTVEAESDSDPDAASPSNSSSSCDSASALALALVALLVLTGIEPLAFALTVDDLPLKAKGNGRAPD